MIMILFTILMLMVFGELLGFALKAAWGVTKVVLFLILLPLILIGLVVGGMIYLALPILAIAGIVMLFKRIAAAN